MLKNQRYLQISMFTATEGPTDMPLVVLRRLQNVPDSTGSFQRKGGAQLALSSLKMENILQHRRGPWKSYSGSTSLVQK